MVYFLSFLEELTTPPTTVRPTIRPVFTYSVMARKIAASTGSVTSKCEPLASAICKGLGYNLTQFPNKLQHNTSQQALSALSALLGKLQSNCSPHLIPFLCQLYLPPCVLSQVATPPCRSLCESVQEDCSLVSWPGHVNCERFPRANNKPKCFLGSAKVTTKRTALIRGSQEEWLTETNSLKPEKSYPTKQAPFTKHVTSTTAPTYRSTGGQQRNETSGQQRNETRNGNITNTSLTQSNFTTPSPSPSEAGL